MQPISTKTRRLKFWLHLISAYISRYKYSVLAVVLTISAAAYLSMQIWPKISRANVVTIGYVGTYSIETIPAEVLQLATQPLITVDQAGKPVPALASHWTRSDDGKTYVVFLKDNLKWHDETPFDAKDITIAIKNVQITALNNKAIEFRLPNPIASFPTALDKPVFKKDSFYGTGQFRITNIKRSQNSITQIEMTPKTKGLPRVEMRFYQTEDQLQDAIKLGDVKYASVASANILENFKNLDVEKTTDHNQAIAIFFNTQDPLLSSKELRQALYHAIDKSGFDGELAASVISPLSWAYNPDVKRYDYNTGRAKELIAKSEAKNPKITLSVVGGLGDVADSVRRNWQDLGIEVEIKRENSIPGNFQALLAVNEIPRDPDQYSFWHSTQAETNLTKYKDVKIDKLLEDARVAQDEEERKKLYFDFQKFLMEDAPIALLYHPYKYKVAYKNTKPLIEKLPASQF